MAGEVQVCYTISKKAYKAIKAGNAMLSSGGVRSTGGSFIELAKPALKGVASGSLTSPLTLASSVANNVQSGFIQRGVNQANAKLDTTLDRLDALQKSVDSLAVNGALSWVNCALGVANCGISIAGFAMTLSKLNDISGKLDALSEKIDYKNLSDAIQEFDEYRGYISEDIARMENESYSVTQSSDVSDHLNKIYAYLKRLVRDFENKKIDGRIACNIIFPMTVAFAREVKEYAARYYYETGNFPPNYAEWLDFLSHVTGEEFTKTLKDFLLFECEDYSTEERYAAFGGVISSVQYQLGNLKYGEMLVQRLEKKDYIHLDDYLTGQIRGGNCVEEGDKICIPV